MTSLELYPSLSWILKLTSKALQVYFTNEAKSLSHWVSPSSKSAIISCMCYSSKCLSAFFTKPEVQNLEVSYFLFAAPLLELARDESVQTKVLDVARQFFSNSNITINLLPALIAAGLLLLLLPLLFLFLAPADDGGASGYGAPAAEYGAPSSSYGAPSSSYGYRSVSILFSFQYEVIRV